MAAVGPDGTVIRLEPNGAYHAERAGIRLALGAAADPGALDAVARRMADEVILALHGAPSADQSLWLTGPLPPPARLDGLVFSGGVSEFVYGTESRGFGDLGPRSARRSRRRREGGSPAGAAGRRRIRATVLGASEYTVQLSGITSYLGSPERTLPRRNLPVARPGYELGDRVDPAGIGEEIRRHVARFDPGASADVAVALHWEGPPEYARLRGLAEAVAHGLAGGSPRARRST